MTHKLLLMFFFFFIGWMFPPVLAPAGLSIMGLLIAQGFPNIILVIIISVAMITSYLPIWWLAGKILYKHKKEDRLALKKQKQKNHKDAFLKKMYESASQIVNDALHSQQFKKLTEYFESKTGKWILFSVMVFLCTPIVSNVIAVLILRKRISLKRMLLVASVGETIGAFTFVYGGIVVKWITQIVIQNFWRNASVVECVFLIIENQT